MNYKWLLTTAVATTLALSFGVGCSPTNTAPTAPDLNGTSSGGGSFGDESSLKLLNWSKTFTADSIRRLHPDALKGLPSGWTQERLARLIESVKPEPKTSVSRYNRELMFDYYVPKSGEPYLVATSLFFKAHSAVPVNSTPQPELEAYLREIRTKLLHEAAHVLGIGTSEKTDIKARAFAQYLNIIVSHNNILCEAETVPESYPGFVASNESTNSKAPESVDPSSSTVSKYVWVINRPTGFSFQSLKAPKGFGHMHWYQKLRNGETAFYSNFALYPDSVENPSISLFHYVRWFEAPEFMKYSPTRWSKQYYKSRASSSNEANFVLYGETESLVRKGTDTTGTRCVSGEQIEIPKVSNGTYAAALTSTTSCAPDSNTTFIVQCRESWKPVQNIEEFFGESLKFSDPAVAEWLRYEGTID